MKRHVEIAIVAAVLAAFIACVITRGGYFRLFWLPVSILIVLVFGAYVLSRVLFGESPGRANWSGLFILLFAGWSAVSIYGSANREVSFHEVLRLSCLAMVYFIVFWGVRNQKLKTAFLIGFIAAIFIEGAYGLYERAAGVNYFDFWPILAHNPSGRANGTFVNSNHFASLMGMGSLVVFGVSIGMRRADENVSEDFSKRLLLAIMGAIMLGALAMSLSRGGWASFVAGAILLVSLYQPVLRRKWLIVIAVALVAATLIGVFVLKQDRLILSSRARSVESLMEEGEISNSERFSVWSSAADMIDDSPLIGTGAGAFRSAYPNYRKGEDIYGFVFAHNGYLQIAAGAGLPALAFFLAFCFFVFLEGFSIINFGGDSVFDQAVPGIMAALFALLAHELVDFGLSMPSHGLLFFALAGLVSGRSAELR